MLTLQTHAASSSKRENTLRPRSHDKTKSPTAESLVMDATCPQLSASATNQSLAAIMIFAKIAKRSMTRRTRLSRSKLLWKTWRCFLDCPSSAALLQRPEAVDAAAKAASAEAGDGTVDLEEGAVATAHVVQDKR